MAVSSNASATSNRLSITLSAGARASSRFWTARASPRRRMTWKLMAWADGRSAASVWARQSPSERPARTPRTQCADASKLADSATRPGAEADGVAAWRREAAIVTIQVFAKRSPATYADHWAGHQAGHYF